MAFEEFKAKGGKFNPQITINNGGGFGLTSGMHHRYEIDKYSAVKLYFDRETNKVGIKLLETEEEGSFKLKKRLNEKGAHFGAKSFIEAYDLKASKISGRYPPESVDDPTFGQMFIITLKNNG